MSRAIKPFSEPGRPADWFSQKVRNLQNYKSFPPFLSFEQMLCSCAVANISKTSFVSVSQHCASQYSELLEATEAPKSVL